MQRPDTPLANTPEPQPVSSGLQPTAQMIGAIPQQRLTTKYEQTANNAIQQIDLMAKMRKAKSVPEQTNQ
jgi:hypothetical protein